MSLKELDIQLFFSINKGFQNGFFDAAMPFITKNYYLFVIILAFILAVKNRKDVITPVILAVISVALTDWLSASLKYLIERPRPCKILEDVRLLVGCGRAFSMPSNHAANAFALIFALSYPSSKNLRWLLIFGGLVVAFSRVYVGVHYPSDVIVGASVGLMVSAIVIGLYKWSAMRFKLKPYTTVLFLALLGISLFRIYYITQGVIDLSPDEAHYWEWSRRLDLSYYSKGPMIAYLIALGTAIFGDNVFGIRVMAVILSALSSVFIFFLGRRLFDEKTGLISAVLLQIIPLYSVYGVLFTIDSPFIFFWVFSLFLFWKAINTALTIPSNDSMFHGKSSEAIFWVLLGISIGFGLLTKYTMAFFYICAFLFLIVAGKYRKILLTKWPYISFAISILVFSPVILWNAKHSWVTLKHTAGQVHVEKGFNISFSSLAEFIGSQLGVLTPVILVLMIYAVFRLRKRSDGGNFLFWFSIPVLVFFVFKSIHEKVQANWALPGYITGIIALSLYLSEKWNSLKKGLKVTVIAGVVLPLVVTAISHYPAILKLPPKIDPTARIRGWKELGTEVSVLSEELSKKGPFFIFSDRYQISSELAFYVKGQPVTYNVNLGRRMNQYNLWPGIENLIGFNAIFVRTHDSDVPAVFKAAFDGCEKKLLNVYTKDLLLRTYSIFTCYNFKGLEQGEITSY